MKKIIMLSVITLFNIFLHAKHDATQIARFTITQSELKSSKKEFVNNTKYHLQLRYSIQDSKTGQQYTQEPIIHRGDRKIIDFADAASHFLPDAQLEYTLELLRVKQLPKGAGIPLIASKLRNGNLAFQISSARFKKDKIFEFYLNNNGLLLHKSH
ncbi:hypothetical protein KAZ82_00445 [Candidatus Babeliales bacterium]|nr:hypothetical protein [Candidatus Babeliales bacterium]